MSSWAMKRFWTDTAAIETDGGYTVELDGRRVKTPAKAALVVPTMAMAEAIAAEWDAQEGEIKPASMPVTKLANAAIDRVSRNHSEVADMLAAYGDSDLTCYRAEYPEGLVALQAEGWDPALDWVDQVFGARLHPRTGLMHQAQDADAIAKLTSEVHAMDAFRLSAFHDLVSVSGSLVLGFAAAYGWRDAAAIWELSRIDEQWQEGQWGADEEASEKANYKRGEFMAAKRHWDLCRTN